MFCRTCGETCRILCNLNAKRHFLLSSFYAPMRIWSASSEEVFVMIAWHEKLRTRIGLRIAGIGFLASAWMECEWLQNMVLASPSAEASPQRCLLAAVMFASASLGLLLTFVGGGLWKPVPVSDRWATRIPMPVVRELEPAMLMMTTARGGNSNQESRDAHYDGERSPVRHSHLPPAGRGRNSRSLRRQFQAKRADGADNRLR